MSNHHDGFACIIEFFSSCISSSPDLKSKLPVGSSAIITLGLVMTAEPEQFFAVGQKIILLV
jgi:hypothetical protein